MKVLLINSHPDYEGNRTTNKLVEHILTHLGDHDVIVKNIYDPNEHVHPISNEMLEMWSNPMESSELKRRQDFLIEEWIEANAVFIASPLHNFNITSKLKDYFDNLLVVHKTFKYTEEGSVGLLDNSKKVTYIQVSGSDYSKDIRYVNADIAPHYLRTLLSFMGITEMNLVRVQGLDLLGADKELIIKNAKDEVNKIIKSL